MEVLKYMDGFLLFPRCGDVVPRGTGNEVWWWCGSGAWVNELAGLAADPVGNLTGALSSSAWPTSTNPAGRADQLDYVDLRSSFTFAGMDMQAMQAMDFGGATKLIVGCPGGRVRVLSPGTFGTNLQNRHSIGQIQSSSEDFGHGGCALASRMLDASTAEVFLGTFYGHAAKNTYPGQSLRDNEVMAGEVRRFTVNSSGQLSAPTQVFDLHPSATDTRGGYGVVGLAIGDVVAGSAGDELVITTLSGDLFVHSIATGQQLFRTYVRGGLGFYNSILIKDLNNDGLCELYIAGSYGIYRFAQPGEVTS
jgi:hypothetical protein